MSEKEVFKPAVPEIKESETNPEELAEEIVLDNRLARLFKDPDIREMPEVTTRIVANALVSATELSLIFGNVTAYGAKLPKIIKAISKLKWLGIKKLDLTPSVSLKETWKIFLKRDVLTLGLWPSHTNEFIRQLKREDLPKMKTALAAAKQIMNRQKTRSDRARADIAKARDAFNKK